MVNASLAGNDPQTATSSKPELVVYTILLRLGLRPQVDFTYQSKMMGGRSERGGAIIDFVFENPPGLAINIQGEFFHYEQGTAQIRNSLIDRELLAGQGITLIFIDAADLERDAEFYVREALAFRDHSLLAGRGF